MKDWAVAEPKLRHKEIKEILSLVEHIPYYGEIVKNTYSVLTYGIPFDEGFKSYNLIDIAYFWKEAPRIIQSLLKEVEGASYDSQKV